MTEVNSSRRNPYELTQFTPPEQEFAQAADSAGNRNMSVNQTEVENVADQFNNEIFSDKTAVAISSISDPNLQRAASAADNFANRNSIGADDGVVSQREMDAIVKQLLEDVSEFGNDGEIPLPDPNVRVRC